MSAKRCFKTGSSLPTHDPRMCQSEITERQKVHYDIG